jgi:hypothetical protein
VARSTAWRTETDYCITPRLHLHRTRAFMHTAIRVALIFIGSVSLASAEPRAKVKVPVLAGSDLNSDACPSTGAIVGLNPQRDGFLSVRSGPGGPRYREIDRLNNGTRVWICDQRGAWMGAVYSPHSKVDCNVGTPWPTRKPYTGPCRYGWVHSKYVGNRAG